MKMNKIILKKNIIIFLISAISIFWFFWLLRQGIALSPDSTNYLNFSIYIKNSLDFSYIYTVWPPAYPIFVAIGQFFIETPSGGATLVSAVMLFLSLFFTNKIMEFVNIELSIRAFAIVLLFLNIKFLYIFQYAWSEGPFTAFFLGAVYFLMRHYQEEKTKYLLFASFFVAIVALSRYLGYSLIIMLMLYVFYFNFKKRDFFSKQALIRYFFIGISGFFSFIWILRNYFKDKTFHGPRSPSTYSLIENIKLFIKTTIVDNSIIFIIIVLFFPLVLYLIWQIYKDKNLARKNAIIIFSITVIIYILLTIYSATIARFDKLKTRFFAPIYPFVIFIFALIINEIVEKFIKNKNYQQLILFSLLWIFFIGFFIGFIKFNSPLKYFRGNFNPSMPVEIGYNKSELRQELLSWLNKNMLSEQDNKIFIFVDLGRQTVNLGVTRGLLLRRFDRKATNYSYGGNGRTLQVSYLLNGNKYSLSYIDQQIIDENFKNIFMEEKALILTDQKRFDEIKEIINISNCSITEIHTLYGVVCSK